MPRSAPRSRPSASAILTLPRDAHELTDEVVAMRQQDARGPSQRHAAVRPQARSRAAWSTSSSRCNASCSGMRIAIRSLTRNAGNIALLHMAGELGLVPGPLAAHGRRRVSRLPQPAAQGAPHRRGARARRSGAACRTARSRERVVDARVRRAVACRGELGRAHCEAPCSALA